MLGPVEKVVLSNGRVNRVMKIFEVHGFAFKTGTISLNVGYGLLIFIQAYIIFSFTKELVVTGSMM